jgi:hypothetical protein
MYSMRSLLLAGAVCAVLASPVAAVQGGARDVVWTAERALAQREGKVLFGFGQGHATNLAQAWLEPFPGKILRFAQDDRERGTPRPRQLFRVDRTMHIPY